MKTTTYNYAGFDYVLTLDEFGYAISATPLPGQHPAANKDKHRRNAASQYTDEREQERGVYAR